MSSDQPNKDQQSAPVGPRAPAKAVVSVGDSSVDSKKRAAAAGGDDKEQLKKVRVSKLSFKKGSAAAGTTASAVSDPKAAALAAFDAKQKVQKQRQNERHDKFAMFKFNDDAAPK
jgi:hypothetical protein